MPCQHRKSDILCALHPSLEPVDDCEKCRILDVEPIALNGGMFIFMKDGGIRWFSANNASYQAWLKTSDAKKVSLFLSGKDGVKSMMADHYRLRDLRDCYGDLPDDLVDVMDRLKSEMEDST